MISLNRSGNRTGWMMPALLAITMVVTALVTVSAPVAAPPAGAQAVEPEDIDQWGPGVIIDGGPPAIVQGVIPDGVCSAFATLTGGGGGANSAFAATPPPGSFNADPILNRGGDSAEVTIDFTVHPGQAYLLTVASGGGGAGVISGGANGGGQGASGVRGHPAAGGGGRSELEFAGVLLASVGGGGGSGGGHWYLGMDGGDAGVPTVVGAVAAGQAGEEGRDEPHNNQSALGFTFPGGEGGGTAAHGAGAVNPNPATDPAYGVPTYLIGAPGYDDPAYPAGSGRGNGGDGPADPNLDAGGGGGAGYFGGGSGASTDDEGNPPLYDDVTNGRATGGSGGGGGASFVSATPVDGLGTAPVIVSAFSLDGVPDEDAFGKSGFGNAQTGSADAQGSPGRGEIDWRTCEYDLGVTKTADPNVGMPGDIVEWTIVIENFGPEHMSLGDVVTLTDTLPGGGTKTVTGVTFGGTPVPSGLDSTPLTCDTAPGNPMPATITCSRPYSSAAAPGVPAGGFRGLDVGETITITYEQDLVLADAPQITNVATITDRGDQTNNVSEDTVVISYFEYDLGIEKQRVGDPVNNGDGSHTITYQIDVTSPTSTATCLNDGVDPCVLGDNTNVQVTDGLDVVFGGALMSASAAVQSGPCTDNPAPYDGVANINLLVGTDVLAAGEACQILITVIVNTDPDNGDVVPLDTAQNNVATVTSDQSTDTDDADVTLTEAPAIEVTKNTIGGPTTTGNGEFEIVFEILTENTGNVRLDDVQVVDGLVAVYGPALVSASAVVTTPAVCTDSTAPYDGVANIDLLTGLDSLAVGEICRVEITAVVTTSAANAAPIVLDTDYTNVADGSGNSPTNVPVSDDDDEVHQFSETPSIGVVKDVVGDPVNNGDGTHTITYSIAVENTGDVILDDVSVTDGLVGVWGTALVSGAAVADSGPCAANPDYDGVADAELVAPATSLAPADPACVFTLTVVVSSAVAPLATDVTNTANATGTSPAGEDVIADDPATTQINETPSIEVTKNTIGGPTTTGNGEYEIVFEILTENTGDVVLEDVQVIDGLVAVYGQALISASAVVTTPAVCTDSAAPYDGVANIDLLTGLDSLFPGDICRVEITAVVTTSAANPDPIVLDQQYTNVAEGSGTPPGRPPITDDDDEVHDFMEDPSIGVVKDVVGDPVNNGDGTHTITYSIAVENTGDVILDDVSVTDGLVGVWGTALVSGAAVADSGPCVVNGTYDGVADSELVSLGTSLAPADPACVFTLTVVVSSAVAPLATDVTNTANATGTSPAGEDVIADDPATTQINETPSIDVVKNTVGGPTTTGNGEYEIVFEIVTTNDGDVVLDDVQVIDGLVAVYGQALISASAVVTTPAVCTDSAAPYDGVANIDLLTGLDSLNAGDVCIVEITAVVTTSAANPDPIVLDQQYTNVAEGSGTPPGRPPITDDDDEVHDFMEDPSIGVVKDVVGDPVNNGDGTHTITYSIAVENTGDVILDDVSVTDGLVGVWGTALVSGAAAVDSGPCAANPDYDGVADSELVAASTSLAPADPACVFTLTVVVSSAVAPLATDTTNVADATGTSPAGEDVTDDDPATTQINETPSLETTKSLVGVPANNQDGTWTLVYDLNLANTGDVVLENVQITDGLVDVFGTDLVSVAIDSVTAPCTPNAAYDGIATIGVFSGTDSIGVGEDCTATITVVVAVDGDRLDTPQTNVAEGSGTPPGRPPITDDDDEVVEFSENPTIEVDKTVVGDPVNNGDGTHTITYSIAVENTGDVDLADVSVTDGLVNVWGTALVSGAAIADSGPCVVNPTYDGVADSELVAPATTLTPTDAPCAFTVTVVVSSATAPLATDTTNVADATGTSPAGEDVTDDDPATTQINENPSIQTVKLLLEAPVNNQDGTWTLLYRVVVRNTGDVVLNNVQATDGLAAVFGADLVSAQLADVFGRCDANPAYDGVTSTGLFSGVDSVPPGRACVAIIEVVVAVDGDRLDTAQTNIATGEGTPPGRPPISEDDDAIVRFTEDPAIDLVKAVVGEPINNEDGTYEVTYTLAATNTGNVDLFNLQLTDGLAATYGAANLVSVTATTSPECTLNPAYTGVAPTADLLTGADLLPIGATCSATITVVVVPGADLGPRVNTATTAGDSPAGVEVTDTDDADVTFEQNPSIRTVKRVEAAPLSNNDGTFTMTWSVVVRNNGDVPLANVQVTDDLSATYADAIAWQLDEAVIDRGVCPATNPGFNGSTDIKLLPGTDTLAVGRACVVHITVTFEPGADLGPYTNVVFATGEPPAGDPVTDDDKEPVEVDENPEITLDKTIAAEPVNNEDGTYDITYGYDIENTGDVPLNGVQLVDDLTVTFPNASSIVAGPVTTTSGPCTPSGTYTGTGDNDMLTGTDGLAVGQSCALTLTVTVTPGADLGPYENVATTSGTSPGGEEVDDTDSTDETVEENPAIRLTKVLVDPGSINNEDGSYNVTWRMTARNVGDVPLANVQITDDMAATFADAISFAIVDGPTKIGGPCSVNAAYDGTADVNLLAGNDTLPVDRNCTVEVTVRVTPGADLGDYINLATATGQSPTGEEVDDTDDAVVDFEENPDIRLVKTVYAGPTNNEDGTYNVTYRFVVRNTGDVPLTDVQIDDPMSVTFADAVAFDPQTVRVTQGLCTASTTFDGVADTGLLSGNDDLAVGAACVVLVEVEITPGEDLGAYPNAAIATGTSPSGEGVDDDSDATITFEEDPAIAVDKTAAGDPVNNGDGTYTVTFDIEVENTGNVPLQTVQVYDDLSETFGQAISFDPDLPVVTDGECTASTAFDGTTYIGLLAGSDTLTVGAACTISLTVTFEPGATFEYNNVAVAVGTSPGGERVDDEDPEVVEVTESPKLKLDKDVIDGPVGDGNGSWTVTFRHVVRNTGNVELRDVRVRDNLALAFAGADSFTVDSVVVDRGICTANTGYDGTTDLDLIDPVTLDVGRRCDIDVTVTFATSVPSGEFKNTSVATGTSPGGQDLEDKDPASVPFAENPAIEITKTRVGEPVAVGDGSFDLTYSMKITNTGDVNLSNVQITDDLTAVYADAVSWSVQDVRLIAGSCSVSNSYDGTTDVELLTGTDRLNIGRTCSLQVDVNVTPGAQLGPYVNRATVKGTSPGGQKTTDRDNESTSFVEDPSIDLIKRRLGQPTPRNAAGDVSVRYSLKVINTGNVPLLDVQIVDDLNETFAAAKSVQGDSVEVVAGACTASAVWDGIDHVALLRGVDDLDPGDSCTVEIVVTLNPGTTLKYDNVAVATGTSPGGERVDDEDDAPVVIPKPPSIDLRKEISEATTLVTDREYDIDYKLTVTNTGDEQLVNVSLIDDLDETFDVVDSWELVGVEVGAPCVANDDFDGVDDVELFDPAETTLEPGESCTVEIVVEFNATTLATVPTIKNVAFTKAETPDGFKVTDRDDVPHTVTKTPPPLPTLPEEPPPPPVPVEVPFVEPPPPPPPPLAHTGGETGLFIAAAGALLTMGGALVIVRRRSEDEEDDV